MGGGGSICWLDGDGKAAVVVAVAFANQVHFAVVAASAAVRDIICWCLSFYLLLADESMSLSILRTQIIIE